MNNLHRELAPISDAAWADLEAEARRTFTRHVAARRVVDVIGPAGPTLAAVGTGHFVADSGIPTGPTAAGGRAVGGAQRPGPVYARVRAARALVEFRVPFVVERQSVDEVERGARDANWQPVKDAAKQMAFAEDGMAFDGFPTTGVGGIRAESSNPSVALPAGVADYPNAVAQAMTELRLAGVSGPYSLLLSADAYTAVAETSDHGNPIREHIQRVLGPDGQIIWAPALAGGLLLSTRGGDFELHLGQDLSIGYLAHDVTTIELYFQESLTFFVQTTEAAVELTA